MTPSDATGSRESQDYLATISDLTSAFIFVFIVMLAIFAYRLATATEEVTAVTEVRDGILTEIADRLEDAGMRVEVLRHQGVLRLSENAINFDLGSDSPVRHHRINVGFVAEAIGEVVPCYVPDSRIATSPSTGHVSVAREADLRPPFCQARVYPDLLDCKGDDRDRSWLLETLLIEGHTDSVPVGPGSRYRNNLELSSMRAATVHQMISACEAGLERLANSNGHPILSTSGYGDARPATHDPEEIGRNRRIDLRFLLEPPPAIMRRGESDVEREVREAIEERRR